MRHGDPEVAYDMLLAASAHAGDRRPAERRGSARSRRRGGDVPRRSSSDHRGGSARRPAPRGGCRADGRGDVDLLVGLGKLFAGDWSERLPDPGECAGLPGRGCRGLPARPPLGTGGDVSRPSRRCDATSTRKAAVHARDSASPGQLTPMLDRLAYIELLLGRLPDAEAHAREGLRLPSDLGLDAGVALSTPRHRLRVSRPGR